MWQNGVVNLKREEVIFVTTGRPSVVTDKIIQKIDENIRADRRLTIDELYQQCPKVSRTVLHKITWLREQAGDFYDAGIKKLLPRLTKCIVNHGDYVEK
jgi:hypothetical protein